jgi:O-antigen/teichoic acid export membrane protein
MIGQLTNKKITEQDETDSTQKAFRLTEKVVRGGVWVFALRITERCFGLVRTIVLARLLAPSDFGLLGVALLVMSALETFSQTGYSAALIQKKEDTRPYLDTAWTVQMVRGTILALVAFIIAPYVTLFFETDAAKPVLQVIALSVLINGFTNIGIVYFQKDLQFHKHFAYILSGTIADIVVTIPAALLLKNVWALVLGLLASSFVRTITSYLIHPYRPRLKFNMVHFRELFGFGRWVFVSTILMFFLTQGDSVFVGRLFSVTALGFYQMAYSISNMSATEISHVISQVTFPAYTKLQNDMSKLSQAYLKVLRVTAFLSFPAAGLIFALGPAFTKIFLGSKWMPMVPAMQALCVFGIVRSIGSTMGAVIFAVGKPKVQTKVFFIQLVILATIIYPMGIKWGILGVAWAITLPNIAAVIIIARELRGILTFTYGNLFKVLLVPAGAALVTSLFVYMSFGLSSAQSNVLGFFTMGVIGGGVYLGIMYLYSITTGCTYNLKTMLDVMLPRNERVC